MNDAQQRAYFQKVLGNLGYDANRSLSFDAQQELYAAMVEYGAGNVPGTLANPSALNQNRPLLNRLNMRPGQMPTVPNVQFNPLSNNETKVLVAVTFGNEGTYDPEVGGYPPIVIGAPEGLDNSLSYYQPANNYAGPLRRIVMANGDLRLATSDLTNYGWVNMSITDNYDIGGMVEFIARLRSTAMQINGFTWECETVSQFRRTKIIYDGSMGGAVTKNPLSVTTNANQYQNTIRYVAMNYVFGPARALVIQSDPDQPEQTLEFNIVANTSQIQKLRNGNSVNLSPSAQYEQILLGSAS